MLGARPPRSVLTGALPRPAGQPLAGLARYEKLSKWGSGMYGDVFKGRDRASGALVAMKRIKLQTDEDDGSGLTGSAEDEVDGVPATALREILALRDVAPHPNVVRLLDVVFEFPGLLHPAAAAAAAAASVGGGAPRSRPQLYLIFEFVDRDLRRVLAEEQELAVRAEKLAAEDSARRAAGLPGSAPSTASDHAPPRGARGGSAAAAGALLVGAGALEGGGGGGGTALHTVGGGARVPASRAGMRPAQVRSFTYQLLRGLAALHAKRLLHRCVIARVRACSTSTAAA